MTVGRSVLRSARRHKLGTLGVLWVAAVGLAAILAPVVAPYGSTDADLGAALSGPSSAHPLGVDPLGYDVLSRMMFGARVTLEGVGLAVLVFVVVGVVLGLVAGYYGGFVDLVVSRAVDVALAIPAVVVLLTVLSVAPNNQVAPMLTFGVLGAPGLARVVRAVTLDVREELYIDAARIFGLTSVQIIGRHVVRRVTGVVIVQGAIFAGVALVVQAGLAFLGFGPRPPAPSWGASIQDASVVINRDPWLLYPTGLIIAFTVLAFGLIGDSLRDASAAGPARVRLGAGRPARPTPDRLSAESLAAPGPLLAVRGLTVDVTTAAGPVRLIDDVSFDIAAGEVLGLVGESGCGKSVTALAVLDVLPAGVQRVAGTVRFAGADLGERQLAALRGREIGYVSQEPMIALDPTFSVRAQLVEAIRTHRGLGRAPARAAAVELLARVGIPDPAAIARRYPHQLSGGLAQRVCIALALAGEPRLLIADEPTTALDVRVQAEILTLLHTLGRETGLAVLLVTHDWGVVADQCERAIVMYAGEVVENADVDTLFARPEHPYTQGLLAASRSLGLAATDGATDGAERAIGVAAPPLVTIPGSVPRPGEWPVGCRFQDRCPAVVAACRMGPVALTEVGDRRRCRCIHVSSARSLDLGRRR